MSSFNSIRVYIFILNLLDSRSCYHFAFSTICKEIGDSKHISIATRQQCCVSHLKGLCFLYVWRGSHRLSVPTSGASCKRPAKAVKPSSSVLSNVFRRLDPLHPQPFCRAREERKRYRGEKRPAAFSSFDNERKRALLLCYLFPGWPPQFRQINWRAFAAKGDLY